MTYTDPVDGGPAVPVANNFDAAVSWAHTYTDEADPRNDVCLNCHEDKSDDIETEDAEWQAHAMVNRVSRIAMDDAEANNGTVAGVPDPSRPYRRQGGEETVCRACHGDEGDPECTGEDGEEWKLHLIQGRVSEHVWEEVSLATTGSTCGW